VASGGWLGLFGGQWLRGAPWNRSDARRNRATFSFVRWHSCPQRSGMVDRATACAGASSEFYESYSSRREAASGLRRVA